MQLLARKGNIRFIALLVCLLCLAMSAASFAGNGDGSGGGSDEPLSLVMSSPASGQQGVSLTPQIKLSFSKNVINMTVRDANSNCFSLYTNGGSRVPITVVMADDQVEPEKKRDVVLVPKTKLQPGTSYIVKIAASLQSKSGVTLGHEVQVAFKTAGSAAVTQTKPVAPQNNEPAQSVQTPQKTETTVNEQTKAVDTAKAKEEKVETTKPSLVQETKKATAVGTKTKRLPLAILGIVVLVSIGAVVIRKLKR